MRRYIYLWETALALGIIVGVNYLFFQDRPGFIDVNPHPYLMVVVLMGARYGYLAGLSSGIISTLLYLSYTLGEGGSKFLIPIELLAAGVVLGLIGDYHKERHMQVEKEKTDVSNRLRELEVQNAALSDSYNELKRRIVGQEETVITLYGAAKSLESLEVEDLYPAILELLVKYLNIEQCSLYLVEGDKFHLKTYKGWPQSDKLHEVYSLDTPMMGEAFKKRRVVTMRDFILKGQGEMSNQVEIIMSAPLTLSNNEVIGVINIEKMPFFQFNPSTVRLFAMMANWASMALNNAFRFQITKDKNIEDEITGAYNYKYFEKRMEEEFNRAQRYSLPLSIILMKIQDYEDISDKIKLLKYIAHVLHRNLRDVDIVARYRSEDTFAMVLPVTPDENAHIIMQRMEEMVESSSGPGLEGIPFKFKFGAAGIKPGMKSYTEMLDDAQKAL